ncbi:MAG: hypothetical protein ACE5KA_07140 [Nitrososphaerales archaeon]
MIEGKILAIAASAVVLSLFLTQGLVHGGNGIQEIQTTIIAADGGFSTFITTISMTNTQVITTASTSVHSTIGEETTFTTINLETFTEETTDEATTTTETTISTTTEETTTEVTTTTTDETTTTEETTTTITEESTTIHCTLDPKSNDKRTGSAVECTAVED